MEKKRLLYYGDSPNVHTGFGNVARHVLSRILDRYEITVFGVNEYFTNPNPLPVSRTISALPNGENDPYGKKKFVEFLANEQKGFDIWFLQNDIHSWGWLPDLVYIVRSRGYDPHIFTYTVVDSPVRKEDVWFTSVVDVVGIPSMYGVNEVLKVDPNLQYKLRHIPHGIDCSEFFPIPENIIKPFKVENMGCPPGTFLITNVNRNSQRKDIARTMIYFSYLRQRNPNVKLYLHMAQNEEQYMGWDLKRVIDTNYNTMMSTAFPESFSTNMGVNTDTLNMIYNASDLVISTSVGEGFGLTCVEAMAAKRLVLMPDNSSLSELVSNERGIPIRCGTTLSEWTIQAKDVGHMRPLCNIEDMLIKTEAVMKKYPSRIAENGYEWVTNNLTWKIVVPMFIDGLENKPPKTMLEGGIEV